MALTLYVATTNPGKLRDLAVASRSYAGRVEFLPLPQMEGIAPPGEDADSFEENARDKAAEYSRYAPGLIVLADDSGLEVDALGGAPGVRSARYAADAGLAIETPCANTDDARNNCLLLQNLRGVPKERRSARYRCVLAAARNGETIAIAEGTVEGTILDAPRGSGGFGYDPLFYLPEAKQTMAEMGLEYKQEISHRGHALRGLLAQLMPSEPEGARR
jgi:XTP/dITP diphosphohydrolase